MNLQPFRYIAPALALLLFNACSGGDNVTTSITPISVNTPDSFNSFSNTTFAASTCSNLPITIPSGIFAAPNGSAMASGTQEDPLDLQTALSSSSPLQPGETLWLDEGVYTGEFISQLKGTSTAPVKVKPLPGKRVVLATNATAKKPVLQVKGEWSEFYGLEVLSTNPNRSSTQDGSNPNDIATNSGVSISGTSNTKVINFIVHDNVGSGVDFWSDAYDSELYGTIIYNNGWTAPGRGHGHAIYAQNRTGTKKLTNNIIFFGFGTGIHIYTQGGEIKNFDVEGNTWFMTGASDPRASQRKDNCLIGGFQPVENLQMHNNQGFSLNGRGTRLGYDSNVLAQSGTLSNNYLSENFWVTGAWTTLDIDSTTIHRGTTGSADNYVSDGVNSNTLMSTPPSSGKKVFVKANDYDPRRAKIVVYNFDDDDTVDVDVSSVLQVGEAYRIHSVYALFEAPILSGVYNGGTLNIPMGSVAPVQPNGINGIGDEDNPQKKFGVFILTHGGC